jgi:hypothetical protein
MKDRYSPGEDLLREVRAGFVMQGTTFSTWCTQQGINRSSARQALMGSWNGPKGRALRTRVVKAAKASAAA